MDQMRKRAKAKKKSETSAMKALMKEKSMELRV